MGSSEECTSANCSQCGVWSGVGQGQQGQEWLPSVWGPSLALPVTQWLVNRVMHLSAFVPLICLSGRDKAGGGDARLGSIVPGCCQTVPICLSFSLLRDCLFCHYFLAAGGSSGNLVNLLTSNCPLLPRSLNKQNGGGGRQAPRTIKVTVKRILVLLDHFTFTVFSQWVAVIFNSFLSEMSGKLSMFCLCFCLSLAEAHIWAWMLNMPHRPLKEGVRTPRDHPTVARAATVRH